MKKRQIKKLTRRAVNKLKLMDKPAPIGTKKIQNAVFLYLHRVDPLVRVPKLYRDFWEAFHNLGNKKA